MKMFRVFVAGTALLLSQSLHGQNYLNEVHLMQNFFRDAAVSSRPYGDAAFQFNDFDGGNNINIGIQGGLPVQSQFEMMAGWAFISFNPSVGEGESGLSDILVAGKYHLPANSAQFSVGGFITLPIGEENLGQGNTNLGGFGAVRYPLAEATVITGAAGLNLLEFGDDRELSLQIGGGIIHQLQEALHLVGELNIESETDFAMLSGGIDYALQTGSRLRGMLGIGLDDGAPDLSLLGTFLFSF